jgi:hypothetical protein
MAKKFHSDYIMKLIPVLCALAFVALNGQPSKTTTFSGINAPSYGGYTNADYNRTYVVPYKEKVGSLTTWELKTARNAQGAYLHVVVNYRGTGKIWQVILEVVLNENPHTYGPVYFGDSATGWVNREPYGGTVVLQ